MPRRLLVVLALMVVGLLGVGVTAAVKRNDDGAKVASPRASASSEPTPEPTFDEPTPAPEVSALPSEVPAPEVTPTPGSTGSGTGSGSTSGGSPQALGPGAPSTPETGPVTAVLFVGAFSAICAVAVHRRFFR